MFLNVLLELIYRTELMFISINIYRLGLRFRSNV